MTYAALPRPPHLPMQEQMKCVYLALKSSGISLQYFYPLALLLIAQTQKAVLVSAHSTTRRPLLFFFQQIVHGDSLAKLLVLHLYRLLSGYLQMGPYLCNPDLFFQYFIQIFPQTGQITRFILLSSQNTVSKEDITPIHLEISRVTSIFTNSFVL